MLPDLTGSRAACRYSWQLSRSPGVTSAFVRSPHRVVRQSFSPSVLFLASPALADPGGGDSVRGFRRAEPGHTRTYIENLTGRSDLLRVLYGLRLTVQAQPALQALLRDPAREMYGAGVVRGDRAPARDGLSHPSATGTRGLGDQPLGGGRPASGKTPGPAVLRKRRACCGRSLLPSEPRRSAATCWPAPAWQR
jgi:hypothetical protein